MNDLAGRIRAFVDARVIPHEGLLAASNPDPDALYEDLPILTTLRAEAKAQGLWNLFLPDADRGMPLTYLDYMAVAEETGRSRLAPLIMNSAGPDSGNIELLEAYGTDAQKAQWLQPLLRGELRSCFAMTEPEVASSDARNVRTRIEVDGDTLRISGRKWWITQAGHVDCKVALLVGKLSSPGTDVDGRHAMVLVPLATPGITIVRRLSVFGYAEDHAEMVFDNVEVPIDSVLGPLGDGLSIAQNRLIGARLHHCMRMVGVAERALEVMIERSRNRVAFGARLDEHETVRNAVAESRIDIELSRSLIRSAAELADKDGLVAAAGLVSIVKVAVPRNTVRGLERAIQVCGGAGVSNDLPLANLFAHARIMRIADGPDDVHKMVIARNEYRKTRAHV